MKITEKWLKEKQACPEGIVRFNAQDETDGIKIVKKLMPEKKLDWANWLIVRLMDYNQNVAYAIYAAEQVIDIYEKQYPNDTRPRNAIEAAKVCLRNPNKENKDAVYAAANAAAYAAANAAAFAANAAFAATTIKKIQTYFRKIVKEKQGEKNSL